MGIKCKLQNETNKMKHFISLYLCLYLYWINVSATRSDFFRGQVRDTPHGCSVTAVGNRRIPKKPAMFSTVKQDNTILTCDKGSFNQIRARGWNRTLVKLVRDSCTTTLPPEEGIRRIYRVGELLYDTFKITVANL